MKQLQYIVYTVCTVGSQSSNLDIMSWYMRNSLWFTVLNIRQCSLMWLFSYREIKGILMNVFKYLEDFCLKTRWPNSLLCYILLNGQGVTQMKKCNRKQPSKMLLISLLTPFRAFRVIKRGEKGIRETLR